MVILKPTRLKTMIPTTLFNSSIEFQNWLKWAILNSLSSKALVGNLLLGSSGSKLKISLKKNIFSFTISKLQTISVTSQI